MWRRPSSLSTAAPSAIIMVWVRITRAGSKEKKAPSDSMPWPRSSAKWTRTASLIQANCCLEPLAFRVWTWPPLIRALAGHDTSGTTCSLDAPWHRREWRKGTWAVNIGLSPQSASKRSCSKESIRWPHMRSFSTTTTTPLMPKRRVAPWV